MDNATLPSKCPGYNLYIDGFQALRRPQVLQTSKITHVVSVIDWKFPQGSAPLRGFQHLHIPLDDVYDSNILAYFPRSNAFIHQGLNYWPKTASDNARESGVLVHCAMGVSRSATIIIAYLMWISRQPKTISQPQTTSKSSSPSDSSTPEMVSLPPTPLTVDTALALLREARPQVEPNSGFIKQLRMYEAMGCPTTQEQLESHKIYRRWMNSRNVMDALSSNRAPEMADITFRDEEDDSDDDDNKLTKNLNNLDLSSPDSGITNPDISVSSPSDTTPLPSPEVELKCRKCRRLIAKSNFIIPHKPPPHRDPSADTSAEPCAHIFLHPLSWMKDTLAQGGLDGRLACPNPKCGANIGKFAWQGLRCSCGGWVTPGFGIVRGKVDQVRSAQSRARGAVAANNNGAGAAGGNLNDAVRLPPSMRRAASTNNGNL
ncbi:tyrosine protein phosphatase yvh1 [Exophiala sideris]|uniref:protein-tyrosine-phosphatase n=1 Tax=Exophiala sideris TaxID=1016849 RepID=A0ABR0JKS0_9EURO|nr:tyrosine protein phosphatase yvh1 [Exophiala sideris]KAK5036149.1 tyrosine protein phosphatase yvh1 [Exophiala sideris]KAK5066532.1 tyrosine protein phosphatase yvh1 [Exophiala sideris]KAK5180354.1 tyrosine protein phosphatase yvh1 [Eurotiomycetes sp. CCFEE 6388]